MSGPGHLPGSAAAGTVLAQGLGPLLGVGAVVTVALESPAGIGLWIAGAGLIVVALAAVLTRVPLLPFLVLGVIFAGATAAAVAGRMSAPSAAGVGVLLLGYVLATDLAEVSVDAAGVGRGGLAGWLRSVVVLFAAGLGAGVAVAAATVLPLAEAGPWPVLLAPFALLVVVLATAGRLRGRTEERHRD